MDFELVNNKWYAWKMLSGENNVKYISPIKIRSVELSTEVDRLLLNFYNACYNNGSKVFSLNLKIVAHSKECLICEIESKNNNKKASIAIIEEIDFQWLKNNIMTEKLYTSLSISEYLDKHFK